MTNDRSSLSSFVFACGHVLAFLLLIAVLSSSAIASDAPAHPAEAPAAAAGDQADLQPVPEPNEIPTMTKIWAAMTACGLLLTLGFIGIGVKLEMDAKKKGTSSH